MLGLSRLLPDSTSLSSDGCLQVAGLNLKTLADKYGTPLYVYDAATILSRVQKLHNTFASEFPNSYEIAYAAKAYFSLGMARKFASMKLCLDTVSLGELIIAKMAGFDPGRVHLHGNNKSEEELRFAIDWGIGNIVVDSLEELEFLEGLAKLKGNKTRIWLRITPGIDVDTHPYWQTGHIASKFGIPLEDGQASDAIKLAQGSKWLELTGLHTHVGSQLFDSTPFQRAISMLMDLAKGLDLVPEWLSTGGGWGVPYNLNDPSGDIYPLIHDISATAKSEAKRLNMPLPKLVIEPGRSLVAQACLVVYSIGTTKFASNGTYIVSVDGGMADNPRVALYETKYSAVLVEKPDDEPKYRSAIVGKFCETGDQLIAEIWMPEVKRGDLIAMPSAGAYQLSMASNYNLSMRPAVLWLEYGKADILQERETLDENSWWIKGA